MRERMSLHRIRVLADRAVARIDREGARGLTMITTEEVEAMAAVIALTNAGELMVRRWTEEGTQT